ncbi:hypothetical protein COLSTE_00024 [Collinsella stercoris DSM 13279]|uniref:Uncharacterized protein n=1 Tax=Collinsella stercoris DSM 13279 TaxID=445975 RepID=B6G7I5_9ACTN|nr:hypothetical protein COLSTE_00024 [Collinsella stercoris DSM 13279]
MPREQLVFFDPYTRRSHHAQPSIWLTEELHSCKVACEKQNARRPICPGK